MERALGQRQGGIKRSSDALIDLDRENFFNDSQPQVKKPGNHGSSRNIEILPPQTGMETGNTPEDLHLKQEESSLIMDDEYEVLDVNLYSGSLEPEDLGTREDESEVWCQCPPPQEGLGGCGEGCDNRARRVECKKEYCRAGVECENMPISNLSADKVWWDQGRLVATEEVMAGRFLAQYTGEVISREEMEVRLATHYRPGQKLHVLPLGDDAVVDASNKGSLCRLATHSCFPNTEVVTWMVEINGDSRACLAMYSLRQIKEGEPISYDYSAQLEVLKARKTCSCGAKNCKKLLGASVNIQGPHQCSVCQVRVLEAGVQGEVWLHPSLALPVCHQCKLNIKQMNWREKNLCRWCVKTGTEGMSCSLCSSHFCRTCLNVNLGPGYIKLAAASLESWTCLLCNSSPLDKLRSRLVSPVIDPAKTGRSPSVHTVRSQAIPDVQTIRSQSIPDTQKFRSQTIPDVQTVRSQTIRPVRPGVTTPRMIRPRKIPNKTYPRPGPGTPALSRGRLHTPRMLGQGVSIQSVATPPPPSAQPDKDIQASRLLSQLQRYGGLSIQPVSEQAGLMANIAKELETAEKTLHAAVEEARRASKDGESITNAKERIAELLRNTRSNMAIVERKL